MDYKHIISDWFEDANQYAKKFGVPVEVVLGIIATESNGNPKAKGVTGDFGLMQITQPALTDYNNTWNTRYTLLDMLNPQINIKVGTWFYARCYSRIKNQYDAFRAYNGGVQGATNNPNLSKDYADKVQSNVLAIATILHNQTGEITV